MASDGSNELLNMFGALLGEDLKKNSGSRHKRIDAHSLVSRVLTAHGEPHLPTNPAALLPLKELRLCTAPDPAPRQLLLLCSHIEKHFEAYCYNNFFTVFTELLVSSQADRLLLMFLRWHHEQQQQQQQQQGTAAYLSRRHTFSSVVGCEFLVQFLKSTVLFPPSSSSPELRSIAAKALPALFLRCKALCATETNGVLFHPAITAAKQWATSDVGQPYCVSMAGLLDGIKQPLVLHHPLDIHNSSISLSKFSDVLRKVLTEPPPPPPPQVKVLPSKQQVASTARKIPPPPAAAGPRKRCRKRSASSSSSSSSVSSSSSSSSSTEDDTSSSSSSASDSTSSSVAKARRRRLQQQQRRRRATAAQAADSKKKKKDGEPLPAKTSPTIAEIMRRPSAQRKKG